uniref:Uncharacterized protein n=1 Tax=Cucumis sativus TaxID=3659 RepID=A0A0A0K3J3_CUCSA
MERASDKGKFACEGVVRAAIQVGHGKGSEASIIATEVMKDEAKNDEERVLSGSRDKFRREI